MFAWMLKGKKTFSGVNNKSEFDIRNVSKAYANLFELKLEWLYEKIEFNAEHPNDSLILSADVNSDNPLPFYVSYQDPNKVCFTRKDDNKEGIIRMEDILSMPFQRWIEFSRDLIFTIFVHHPGQLLRVFDAPVFKTSLGQLLGEQIWGSSSFLFFKISQVNILRRRPDANDPCNISLKDDDLQLRDKVAEDVGCIPVYWTNLRPTTKKLEICKTPEKMEEIWNLLQNFSSIHSTYQPPCNEMKLTALYIARSDPSIDVITRFKYMEQTYEEIINVREFGLESLLSTVGGLIGIFVGTSLSQVPSLIGITLNWLRNQMK